MPDTVTEIGDNVFIAAGSTITNNVPDDSLAIAREMFEGYENHKLGTIAANLNIELENAHRAVHDAIATAEAFVKLVDSDTVL